MQSKQLRCQKIKQIKIKIELFRMKNEDSRTSYENLIYKFWIDRDRLNNLFSRMQARGLIKPLKKKKGIEGLHENKACAFNP